MTGGFVHVPYMHAQVLERLDGPPSLSIEAITQAVGIAVKTAAAAGRAGLSTVA